MLVHHPDPGVDPVARGVEGDRRAVDLELALVGAIEAGEDVRQRALAGAVLAEQGVDLALERLEVDGVVGDDPGKALGDPAARDRGPRTRGQPTAAAPGSAEGSMGDGHLAGGAAAPLPRAGER